MSIRCAAVLAASFALMGSASAADPSYTKDVKPFLVKYCADCHTAMGAKAGFNFDTYAGLTKSGKKGAAVVPEKPEKSMLMLTMTGGAKVMPPKKSMNKPTKAEIDMVRDWIKNGAKDDSK
jgi:mono/diheme cytochrome c family protein